MGGEQSVPEIGRWCVLTKDVLVETTIVAVSALNNAMPMPVVHDIVVCTLNLAKARFPKWRFNLIEAILRDV